MLKQNCVLKIGFADKKIVMDQTPMRMKLQWNFNLILLNLSHIDMNIRIDRTLKLNFGSCYLPHPNKEDTGAEDAHFICSDELAIGVADVVGGLADIGIDAGKWRGGDLMYGVNERVV
uniref:Protein phosphatase n=1 Tax=Solanum lycopersicum TaxID=4081 RepID=A0A3Q7JA18_SOLLC